MAPVSKRAFTLVELLVVLAVIGILVGVLLPALAGARQSARAMASAANLRQIGLGLGQYLIDHDQRAPQLRVDGSGVPVEGSAGDNIGSLFAGKLGTLPAFGIGSIGPSGRPLNRYLSEGPFPDDDSEAARSFELELMRDPTDAGMQDPFLAAMGADLTSIYNLLGTSYNFNDHALDTDPTAEPYPTLIPAEGGRMPRINDAAKTWIVASQPIYNYDDGTDRAMRWSRTDTVQANMLFVDLHAAGGVPVARDQVQTTSAYTFLPRPDWLDQFEAP